MSREVKRKPKRGVPIGLTIAICAVCSAVAFSVAYIYAMNTFNSKVTDLSEKQAMFTKLSEVDSAIRENYEGSIPEDELEEALSSTYVKNIDRDNILYVAEKEYDEDTYSEDYKSFKISDGSYVLIKKSALKTNE
jgi:carboxyl-terminal processing protease